MTGGIAHLIPCDGVGGVEVAVRSMSRRASLPCEFHAFLLTGRKLDPASTRTVDSPYRGWLNPLAHMRLVQAVRREQPQLILCSLWRTVPAAVLLKWLHPSTRLVLFLHLDVAMHWADRLMAGIALRAADAVWADSATTLGARVPSWFKGPRRVVSFVTDRPPALPSKETVALRFISWSRLHHQKGVDRALALIDKLARRGLDPRFDIWGPDGGEQRSLIKQVEMLGLERHVAFRGVADHASLPALASEASFLLQLSRFEGMAMAVVEAMQLGLVPVVTPVGEIGRYVDDGHNGIIVDPALIDTAADRIVALLNEHDRYRAISAAAAQTWQREPLYADDVCQAAAELLNGSQGRP